MEDEMKNKLPPPKKLKKVNDLPYAQAHVRQELWDAIQEVRGDYTIREIIEWGMGAWLAMRAPEKSKKLGVF